MQLTHLDAWLKEKYTWQQRDDDWFYGGPCQRCGHDVEKRFTASAIVGFQEGKSEPSAMRCNCVAPHEGREGDDGCGAWWGLGLTPTAGST